jgi:hypothetical protein
MFETLKNKLISGYIKTHQFLYDNFGTSIYYINNNNKNIKIKDNYYKTYYLLKLVPFLVTKLLIHRYNYEIIYQKEGYFYSTQNKSNHILPFIMEFKINQQDYLPIFKLFNPSLTFNIFIEINNLSNDNIIEIKYMKKGKINFINKKLGDLTEQEIHSIFI